YQEGNCQPDIHSPHRPPLQHQVHRRGATAPSLYKNPTSLTNVPAYRTFHFPICPAKGFAGGSKGAFAPVIEGWQTSWIVNLSSGLPLTMRQSQTNGQSSLYGLGTPDQVRPFDFKGARGVSWPTGANAGNYFGNVFTKVQDPQCAAVDPS